MRSLHLARLLLAASLVGLTAPGSPGLAAPTSQGRDGRAVLAQRLSHSLSGLYTHPPRLPKAPGPRSGARAQVAPIPIQRNSNGCRQLFGTNVRVNQKCDDQGLLIATLGPATANNNPSAMVNPRNAAQILVAANDYRTGDSRCTAYFSFDNGGSWGESEVPFGFVDVRESPEFEGVEVARHYWHASGNGGVAFDSTGRRAYLACLGIDRPAGGFLSAGDNTNGIYVLRSEDNGATWRFPATEVDLHRAEATDTDFQLLDRPHIAADSFPTSPFRDRVYVAWVEVEVEEDEPVQADILFSYSTDNGNTFSAPMQLNGSIAACAFEVNPGGATCDANSFPEVVVGPDGAVYVVYTNYNALDPTSGPENYFNILLQKSTDGGVSFGPPVLVSRFYDLPDCWTYTGANLGFSCVPDFLTIIGSEFGPPDVVATRARRRALAPRAPRNGFFQPYPSVFAASNYPTLAVEETNPNRLYVHFGSYISRHSNENPGQNTGNGLCFPEGFSPATGLPLYDSPGFTFISEEEAVPGCNNSIVQAVSDDGGATWSGGVIDPRQLPVVNDETSGLATDQFWQWTNPRAQNGNVDVAYYDRKYPSPDQCGGVGFIFPTGFPVLNGLCGRSDVTLATSKNQGASYLRQRVSTGTSNAPTDFNGEFMGDHSALAVSVLARQTSRYATAVWTDTRNPALVQPSPGGAIVDDTGGSFLGEPANDTTIVAGRVMLTAR